MAARLPPQRIGNNGLYGTAVLRGIQESPGRRMELMSEMVVFAKVVDLRGFSQAARQLGLTSSAVSRSR